jgi:hypothetical protein
MTTRQEWSRASGNPTYSTGYEVFSKVSTLFDAFVGSYKVFTKKIHILNGLEGLAVLKVD